MHDATKGIMEIIEGNRRGGKMKETIARRPTTRFRTTVRAGAETAIGNANDHLREAQEEEWTIHRDRDGAMIVFR